MASEDNFVRIEMKSKVSKLFLILKIQPDFTRLSLICLNGSFKFQIGKHLFNLSASLFLCPILFYDKFTFLSLESKQGSH